MDSSPKRFETIHPILSWTSSKSASGRWYWRRSLTWSIERSRSFLVAPTEPVPPVVQDLHRDPEALARLAEHVLGRHLHIIEVEAAEVVAAQAHGVEPLADLEALHPLLEDQCDVALGAIDLAAGEGGEHVALRAVADVALLAVQHPRAIGLLDGTRLDLVRVGARLGLGKREPRELSPRREVGKESLLL